MAASTPVGRRIDTFKAVFDGDDATQIKTFSTHLNAADGNIDAAILTWKSASSGAVGAPQRSPKGLQASRLRFVNSLADITDDNPDLVRAITREKPDAISLRDVALGFSKAELEKLAASNPSTPSPAIFSSSSDSRGITISSHPGPGEGLSADQAAKQIRRRLFTAEPTAVVQRMLRDGEVKLAAEAQVPIHDILDENPAFDLRSAPASAVFKDSAAFRSLPDETKSMVETEIKMLQRVQALTPVPDAIPSLVRKGLTSAMHISNIPEDSFVRAFSSTLGEPETATNIHRHAVATRVRNEHFLVTALQTVRGSGLRVIDGGVGRDGVDKRINRFNTTAVQAKTQVNLERLFGTLDYCECSDCNSVYSPASYFVELLEFLRHNNLDPDHVHQAAPNSIRGTQLEQLLLRRPDLACIQLTCENTNTLIPYIDLALEVMESYLVHAPRITAYNVSGETSSELLCQPQHTDPTAYETLRKAVYPLALPYNLAIDTMRVFLGFLKTSRAEMLQIFQPVATSTSSPSGSATLVASDRSRDAEFSLITQEEYVILTKEGFQPLESRRGNRCSEPSEAEQAAYSRKIQLRQPWEYYGYATEADMWDDREDPKTGLTWVKAQFLKRTGINYVDLVDLLRTRYINTNLPVGEDLATMEKIRFSYRFLSYLVDWDAPNRVQRYKKLICFLELAQPLIPLIEWAKAHLNDPLCPPESSSSGDGCGCKKPTGCCCTAAACSCGHDWKHWVYKWFDKVGKVIVLESGEGPMLPIRGRVWAEPRRASLAAASQRAAEDGGSSTEDSSQLVGTLRRDGGIVSESGKAVAFVTVDGRVIDPGTGNDLNNLWRTYALNIYASDDDRGDSEKELGYIALRSPPDAQILGDSSASEPSRERVSLLMYYDMNSEGPRVARYSPAQDTCDITKVRLLHLDGTSVCTEEYDRMGRFLRLWRKMGWTIPETDEAVMALGKEVTSSAPLGEDDAGDASSSSSDGELDDNLTARCSAKPAADINPSLIHQLVALKRLLDLTGLRLSILLSFWHDMPTFGSRSVYAKTFLTHNLLRLDDIFQADEDGNYLTNAADVKITDHLPVLQSALQLKADDIAFLRSLRNIPDKLSLQNVSELYRFSKLARLLSVPVTQLGDIIAVFGQPFHDKAGIPSADVTLELLETWQRMGDSGFTFPQLNYIIRDEDNVSHPLAPGVPQVLRLTKTIVDGLMAIDQQQPDILPADIENQTVTLPEVIPAKLALFFDTALASKINDFVNGQLAFTTNAPASLTLNGVPLPKIKYATTAPGVTPPSAQLTVTGILTEDEAEETRNLSPSTSWRAAIDRVKKQATTFYNQTIAIMLPPDGAATMLQGDSATTPVIKGLFLLRYFMPVLRSQLATKLAQSTVSDAMGLGLTLTAYLLTVVRSSSGKTALEELLALRSSRTSTSSVWNGFIIPPATTDFTFTVTSDEQPAAMMIGSKIVSFPHQSDDPSNLWSSDPTSLIAGTVYPVTLSGFVPEQLAWRTPTTPSTTVPSSALIPGLSSDVVRDVLSKLAKLSLLVQGFNLSLDEVAYFYAHASHFFQTNATLDKLPLDGWRRLNDYVTLRDKLPKRPKRLIDLFTWAAAATSSPPSSNTIVTEINSVTMWDETKVVEILTGFHALDVANFTNEKVLIRLQAAMQLVRKVQIDVAKLFEWSRPVSVSDNSYRKLVAQATVLKNALRSRYEASDWEQAAKPLFDTLRKNQRDALVAYLVMEESLVKTGLVNDADGLFEYFLIDCQMSSCLETSRIKQAIATVQLYVQRCLLGLETEVAQDESDRISRERWDWMKRYRVWEANRQVYLYPENWIVPSLRDDKSPFFLDLESELQQKDVSLTSAVESLKSYLYQVAEVANMKVYGLFIQPHPEQKQAFGVHVAARRMNAPFDWYSRDYSTDGYWSPWVKMPIDIPNYEVEDEDGNSLGSGAYVSPFLWHGQPVLFFLQMIRKQLQPKDDGNKTMMDRLNQDSESQRPPRPMWEIRLGYSIFRNGKWGKKQLSKDSLRHKAKSVPVIDPKDAAKPENERRRIDVYKLPDQTAYQMVPRQVGDDQITVDIGYRDGLLDKLSGETDVYTVKIGYFVFVDGGVSHAWETWGGHMETDKITSFHYIPGSVGATVELHSFQAGDASSKPPYQNAMPLVRYEAAPVAGSKSKMVLSSSRDFTFNHTFLDPLLSQIGTSSAIKGLYASFASLSEAANTSNDDPFGKTSDDSYDERMSPYALYNWEIGLHAPMTLIDGLLKAQQFDDALEVCHTIFDPSAIGASTDTTGDNKKYWKFFPFKDLANTDAKESLEKLFLGMQPQQSNDKVNDWRNHPFSPHAVARARPVAYMKWIAMKYIEIMIAYGDYYFRQNSLETIPSAIQCYVIASHVYGPRGQKIPRRGKKAAQTYSSLLSKWNAFGNAIVELEVEFPFSNQTSLPIGSSNGVVGFANIFGFATSLYFCIPDNPKLRQLRDTIDDRLYKIRNCMDINGVVRHLALWDPPIDPALLVQATAQGLSLDSVLNDLSGPIPNYRFHLLLQKAFELCAELKSLGAGLVSAKEKKDAEALAVLRSSHETVIHTLTLDIRNRQVDEATAALDQLVHSRQSPAYRHQFYKFLVGNTDAAPGENDDFNEIPNPSLAAPTADGSLLLISEEKEEVDKASAARDWNLVVGGAETLAALFHAFPQIEIAGKPMGVGTGLQLGGVNFGNVTSAVARGLQIYAAWLSASSSNAGRKAGLLRALQDRVLQANTTGLELKNIDKQIASQRVRLATAQQEVKNQETNLEQATAVDEFLRGKYTNEELYGWMEGVTKGLYQTAYNLAFDLAKRAEKAFKFERPQMNNAEYIRMGYWTTARDGLLAGEQLFLGLKQLEAAYQETMGHDFEVAKSVSVRQWAPLALVEFRETGSFELSLPEILFDMDMPGHYQRRISSVTVTIPCVAGPYTGINCTVRLLQHTIRTTPRASSKRDYPRWTDDGEDDDRFSTMNIPISAVALSSGQADGGRHQELSLASDRYNPFEGAGVISRWRFELPTALRAFDYMSISDVVLNIKYTSRDGGDKLRKIASDVVADYVKSLEDESADTGLFTLFDLASDFAGEWYAAGFGNGDTTKPTKEMRLNGIADRLPLFTRRTKPNKIIVTSMALVAKGTSTGTAVVLNPQDVKIILMPGEGQTAEFKEGGLGGIGLGDDLVGITSVSGLRMPATDWKLVIGGESAAAGGLERVWLVVRYALT
ncbi:hypothetical protein B0H63DRAFT_540294 [Podospora didyma]|uniref:Insecticidal toxin complex protein n=1 Tax=Podospora didyma TaxID=330526 RepID=A0AAE0NRN6_9PEZI|nr:hypothetical protein B0H63DRAFT_540294 [Podospora didyma]